MKILFFFYFLLIFSWPTFESKFHLTGTWTIVKYHSAPISAMTDSESEEWVRKQVTFGNGISFPFSKISNYKDEFNDELTCGGQGGHFSFSDSITSTTDFFGDKFNPKEVGITAKTVRVLKTNCSDTPFQEIAVKNDNEIIIQWDGIFFILHRDKK
jgi:hypothetical protein